MKPITAALLVAAGVMSAGSARAEDVTDAPVRIDASSAVMLEHVDEKGDAIAVCIAPCDRRLDTGAEYRIHGSGIRPSNVFRLEEASTTIATKPKSNGSFDAGVVLLGLSGAFMVAGALAVALPFVLSPNNNHADEMVAAFISTPLFAAGLATGIPGTVLVANNWQSSARPLSMRTGRGVTLPLVSVSF
jgi:hypothetical protein